ncbi:hypothetical protein ACJX0J_034536, partial [Zea mays]
IYLSYGNNQIIIISNCSPERAAHYKLALLQIATRAGPHVMYIYVPSPFFLFIVFYGYFSLIYRKIHDRDFSLPGSEKIAHEDMKSLFDVEHLTATKNSEVRPDEGRFFQTT